MRLIASLCLQNSLHSGFFLYNRGWLGDLLAEYVSLDKVWKPNGELI